MEKGISSVFSRYLTLSSIKYLSRVLLIITLLLMATVLFLEWMAAAQVRELVISKFNLQQLLLARGAATQIKNNVDLLKDKLQMIKYWPIDRYNEDDHLMLQLRKSLESSRDNGLLMVRVIDKDKRVGHVLDYKRGNDLNLSDRDSGYLTWAGLAPRSPNSMLLSDVYSLTVTKGKAILMMDMAVPLWDQPGDAHKQAVPQPINTPPNMPAGIFKGVLVFTVDVNSLIGKVAGAIISGKTGHAWVIDNKGLFLFHPDPAFIGKNAFEIKKQDLSYVSFGQINRFQRELMLAGKEGMSLYQSGRHRDSETDVTKLIAFTPVNISDSSHTWSVAVVAPLSEVEDEVHSIQLRQFVIGGVFISVLILLFVLIIRILTRWTGTLTTEVDTKTRELRKSVRQYRSLVENAHDVIFSVDKDTNILSMNIFGYLFFKTKPKEVLGKGIGDLFASEARELVLKAIRDVCDFNISKQKTVNLSIGGKDYWLSINFTPLIDERGAMYAVLGIARDITEEFLIEQNMMRTEKLASLGTMVAGVAHEINNPVAIILGFTDMLSEKISPDSEVYDILKIIEKQANNAKRVVENLLSFARCTEQSTLDERLELVEINKIIEELFSFIGKNLKLKKITVQKHLSEEVPIVRADPVELQQVLLNIINNAEFSMKGGGVLTVATDRVDGGEGVEIRLSDTGEGIRKEHRLRVFDPLFTTKKVGEGTGLGLSVSYGIITKYGGTVSFETKTIEESEDTGTTFIITLPATQTETIAADSKTEEFNNNVLA
ncbi:multi-sensor signal transduction histidine kinase [Candidatus Magnetobacterium bavaricum]|uniref:histidine kinase n=1 Tax=Candidatus Magnetobacterium bavaricum TaxID=29290 RepID=A0A0F3GVB7_9BACT|nr:multi-sensor signal transduction histidine kinase [Candidatus Magnetobacterium bavaricum]